LLLGTFRFHEIRTSEKTDELRRVILTVRSTAKIDMMSIGPETAGVTGTLK